MKLTEKMKLFIFEACAAFCGILTIVFTFIPAYFEADKADLSLFEMAVGSGDRLPFNTILFLGFILLVIGVLCAICLAVFQIIKVKFLNDKIITIMAIVAGLCILAGGIIMTCGLFISGLDKANSSLGFTQGNWGIKVGMIITPIFALISFALCYPSALIILHHKDEEDKAAKAVVENK
jgi:hypothetical protein